MVTRIKVVALLLLLPSRVRLFHFLSSFALFLSLAIYLSLLVSPRSRIFATLVRFAIHARFNTCAAPTCRDRKRLKLQPTSSRSRKISKIIHVHVHVLMRKIQLYTARYLQLALTIASPALFHNLCDFS